jgi:hypothetical protein
MAQSEAGGAALMITMHDLVFLFDVDNTLLDNDRVQADLATYLIEARGVDACKLTGIVSNSCGASSAMPTTCLVPAFAGAD